MRDIYTHHYIYIYIYREREREREVPNKDLPYSTLYSIFCSSLYGKKSQKRVDICICITDSL